MSEHVTTNIRLPKELHRALKRRAAAEDKSLAEILREAAARYLAELKTPRDVEIVEGNGHQSDGQDQVEDEWDDSILPPGMTREEYMKDPVWLIGTDPGGSETGDGSINHDLHLYGPLSETARAEVKDGPCEPF